MFWNRTVEIFTQRLPTLGNIELENIVVGLVQDLLVPLRVESGENVLLLFIKIICILFCCLLLH